MLYSIAMHSLLLCYLILMLTVHTILERTGKTMPLTTFDLTRPFWACKELLTWSVFS